MHKFTIGSESRSLSASIKSATGEVPWLFFEPSYGRFAAYQGAVNVSNSGVEGPWLWQNITTKISSLNPRIRISPPFTSSIINLYTGDSEDCTESSSSDPDPGPDAVFTFLSHYEQSSSSNLTDSPTFLFQYQVSGAAAFCKF